MKIKADDKDKLFRLLDERLETIGHDKIMEHKARNLGKDKDKRFRWDLLCSSKIVIGDGIGIHGDIDLYGYMNDLHIDTVLKLYVSERY